MSVYANSKWFDLAKEHEVVKDLLHEKFNIPRQGLEVRIEDKYVIAFTEFSMPKFVVNLATPVSRTKIRDVPPPPGCEAIPDGTKTLIMGLSHHTWQDFEHDSPVENHVGMMNLISKALSRFEPHIVPRVYGWGNATRESPRNWILHEFMPGQRVSEVFDAMSLDGKSGIAEQMAGIVKALQDYSLPRSIKRFGGVSFDENGQIVSASSTNASGFGPWESYDAYLKDVFKESQEEADASEEIEQSHEGDVGTRPHNIAKNGLTDLFRNLSLKEERCIVHGRLTLENVLIDSATRRISALIDYQSARVMHPAHEFFTSNAGPFEGPKFQDVATVWEAELESKDVKRPIKNNEIATLNRLRGLLNLWIFKDKEEREELLVQLVGDLKKEKARLLSRFWGGARRGRTHLMRLVSTR